MTLSCHNFRTSCIFRVFPLGCFPRRFLVFCTLKSFFADGFTARQLSTGSFSQLSTFTCTELFIPAFARARFCPKFTSSRLCWLRWLPSEDLSIGVPFIEPRLWIPLLTTSSRIHLIILSPRVKGAWGTLNMCSSQPTAAARMCQR